MKNKPGFKVKLGGETVVYVVIILIIILFIIFMPNIYKFISAVKTGNVFKKQIQTVIPQNEVDDYEETKSDNNDELTSDLVCIKNQSSPEGNFVDKYIFYYDDTKLTSIKNEKSYDAVSDDYLNFVYAEQARFNNINNLYKNVSGFHYNYIFESNTLKATFTYDLSTLNLDNLSNNDEELSVDLHINKSNTIDEVKEIYTNLEFDCE